MTGASIRLPVIGFDHRVPVQAFQPWVQANTLRNAHASALPARLIALASEREIHFEHDENEGEEMRMSDLHDSTRFE